jgi:hypothetical protein
MQRAGPALLGAAGAAWLEAEQVQHGSHRHERSQGGEVDGRDADANPGEEAAHGDFRLVGPGAHEVNDLVARIVGNPATPQGSPSSFFSWTCSSMSSPRTSFLRWSLAWSCSISLAAVVEGDVAIVEGLLLPA